MSYIVLCPTCEELVTKVYEPDGLCDSCTAESFGLPNLPVEALTPWNDRDVGQTVHGPIKEQTR